MLGIACFFDYKKGRIPNKLIVLGVVAAVTGILVRAFISSGMDGTAEGRGVLFLALAVKGVFVAMVRAFGVVAVFYLLFMLGMLGAGDVKLCAVAVLFLDLRQSILFLATGFLMAAAVSTGKMLFCGNLRERMSYFFSYVTEIVRTGKVVPYFREELALVEKKAVVHMAGPMLAGLMICWCFDWIGGLW